MTLFIQLLYAVAHFDSSKLGFFRIFIREKYKEIQMLIYSIGSVLKNAKAHNFVNRNAIPLFFFSVSSKSFLYFRREMKWCQEIKHFSLPFHQLLLSVSYLQLICHEQEKYWKHLFQSVYHIKVMWSMLMDCLHENWPFIYRINALKLSQQWESVLTGQKRIRAEA